MSRVGPDTQIIHLAHVGRGNLTGVDQGGTVRTLALGCRRNRSFQLPADALRMLGAESLQRIDGLFKLFRGIERGRITFHIRRDHIMYPADLLRRSPDNNPRAGSSDSPFLHKGNSCAPSCPYNTLPLCKCKEVF